MPRKRNEFGSTGNAKLVALMNQGGTAKSIAAALTADGIKGASATTVGARMQELRGFVRSPSSPDGREKASRRPVAPSFARDLAAAGGIPPEPPPSDVDAAGSDGELPSDDEVQAVLAGAPAMHRELLSVCWSEFRLAEGPLKASWASKLLAAMTEARKATPPAPPDPNENPDMVKLGQQVAERLHKMIDIVAERER